MKKYPSTEQFRNIIKQVHLSHDYQGKDEEGNAIYRHLTPYPTLKFRGTAKLHGTNAGIALHLTEDEPIVKFQSRERVLSFSSDNSGFMAAMHQKDVMGLFLKLCQINGVTATDSIVIFGEWCGGNIQKGVALNGLPKMFVIFAVQVDDGWIELPKDLHLNEQGIYNILQFPTYEIEIDFNKPELAQNKLIEMTLEVENECPVGKHFGVSGIGEGIVFSCIEKPGIRFKSKGVKHSSSKVKTLNPVDIESIEGINEFVESAVSENRLEQGLSYFIENNISIEPKNTGEFIRWVVTDVIKEEWDTVLGNNLNEGKVKSGVSTKARVWYLNHI